MTNPDQEYRRQYYLAHQDEIRAKNRAYRATHQDEIVARRRAYYLQHREQILAKVAAYRATHQDQIRSPKRLRIRRARAKALRDTARQAMVNALGGKCRRCGEADARVLQIHHLNGDGQAHRHATARNYNKVLRDIILDSLGERFSLLCANCHVLVTLEEPVRGVRAGGGA